MNQDKTLRLQTILKPTPEICSVPELYYHVHDGVIDFDGYFNFFAIDKWRTYTQISNLHLCLRVQGVKEIILYCDRTPIEKFSVSEFENDGIDIAFPYSNPQHQLVFWFSIVPDGNLSIDTISQDICGYYYTIPETFSPKTINIAAVICTFKRETYVCRNVKQLKESILSNGDLEVSRHFRVFVVDNGKTLRDYEAFQRLLSSSGDQIIVFENKNAGGAGGFTRGMMEAILSQEQYGLTHVLLMDDDAINEPDAIVRLYALLASLKEEWADTAVGGAILREDFPFILYENGAKWDGKFSVYNGPNDLRAYNTAVLDYNMKPYGEHTRLSGWWFYCAPLTTVRADNLPLQYFIHMDDIEYSIRNRSQGLIFLNGIAVWHRAFSVNDPSMNAYSYARNGLITAAVHSENNRRFRSLWKGLLLTPVISYIVRYRYSDIRVLEKAVNDFLRGPEFLLKYDPTDMLKDIGSMSVKFHDLGDYADSLSPEELVFIQQQLDTTDEQYLLDELSESRKTSLPKIVLTLNGWLLPANKPLAVQPVTTTPVKLYRAKKAVLFEPYSKKVYIGQKSYRKLLACIFIYLKCLLKLLLHPGITRDYKDAFPRLVSMKTWQKYLDLDDEK